jgi:hypothetical protein
MDDDNCQRNITFKKNREFDKKKVIIFMHHGHVNVLKKE